MQGRVVGFGTDTVFVAIGVKTEAVIGLAEFRDPETDEFTLAVGDTIEATVTDDGQRSGTVVLKRTLGRGGYVPGELEQAAAHGIAVEGLVTGQNKGGYDVQVAGVRAFCPASQMDVRRAEPADYVGQRLRFRVMRVEAGGRNVVLARRPLLEEEAAAAATRTLATLRVGVVVQGTVTSVRDFGAFVDVGGIEGLVHVSELGHARAAHPSEVLAVGQTVQAQVVKLEPGPAGGRPRVGLSLRALAPDPWASVGERFPVGAHVRGRVRRLEQFGAFVELAPGIDGLVHVSRLAVDRRISHPRQVVAIDAEVDVTVVSVDADKRRIGLSMVERVRATRQAAEDEERRDTDDVLAAQQAAKAFGTLAELLASSKKPTR